MNERERIFRQCHRELIAEMTAMLKRLQWADHDELEYSICPECGVRPTNILSSDEHKADCKISALLKKAES